jgi:hypothetical protein
MRTPIYRNLDRPFQIFAFSPLELTVLCVAFVGLGEIAQSFSLSRIWSFILTGFVALSFYLFRRSMGDFFGRRLLRFLNLPTEIHPRLLIQKGLGDRI